MAEPLSFEELIARTRRGDEQAAAELVRRYEPAIRRAVRVRMTDSQLRRSCDSMDVCQSVLASFFVRVALGQYELQTPEQLLQLLTTMARNKLLNQSRQQHAACRDARRLQSDVSDRELASPAPGPSELAEMRELLQMVQQRLDPDTLRLVELRSQGHSWSSIAGLVGGNAVALRQKLHRALARLSQDFGLEEGEND